MSKRRNRNNNQPVVETQLALAREQKAVLELTLETKKIAALEGQQKKLQALESFPDFVNMRDYLPPEMQNSWGYLSTLSDRQDGRNRPFVTGLQDVAMSRGMARLFDESNSVATGIRQNLQNYIVNNGFSVEVQKKGKDDVSPDFIEACQQIIEEFMEEHDWKGDYDRELFWRPHRDGDSFACFYPNPRDGTTHLRMAEPEQINENTNITDDDITQMFGIEFPYNMSRTFGLHTPEHDAAKVYGYFMESYDGDFNYMPSGYVIHKKMNVDRNIKRGLSDYYAAYKWLTLQERLLENTALGGAAQAAIAWIEQYAAAASPGTITNPSLSTSDQQVVVTTPGGNQRTDYYNYRPGGTVLHVGKGKEYLEGPTGSDRGIAFLQIEAACLRIVGARFSMPEYMISGDASNSNMASTIEAGTPFDEAVKCLQGDFGRWQSKVFMKVLYFAWRSGRLDQYLPGIAWPRIKQMIEVVCAPPVPAEPNPLPFTQRNILLLNAGAMSMPTLRSREGLDDDKENALGAKPPQQAQPGDPNHPGAAGGAAGGPANSSGAPHAGQGGQQGPPQGGVGKVPAPTAKQPSAAPESAAEPLKMQIVKIGKGRFRLLDGKTTLGEFKTPEAAANWYKQHCAKQATEEGPLAPSQPMTSAGTQGGTGAAVQAPPPIAPLAESHVGYVAVNGRLAVKPGMTISHVKSMPVTRNRPLGDNILAVALPVAIESTAEIPAGAKLRVLEVADGIVTTKLL